MITPGEAATIPAELAMPDLDLIKQGEQGRRTGAGGGPGAGRVIPQPRTAGGRHLWRPATSSGVCGWSRPTTPTPRTPQSARMAPARIGSKIHRRDFAADLLQVAGRAIIDSIDDCKNPSPPFRGEREGPLAHRRCAIRQAHARVRRKGREGEVGGAANRFVGPPHPALSPRPAGGEGRPSVIARSGR